MSQISFLTALRSQNPLVHCITNYLAMNVAANVVLAAGASPAMVHAPEEMAEFTPICSALTINMGTLSAPWLASMTAATTTANMQNIPWVLDPVAHFITDYRKQAAQHLLRQRPTIIRGNASEILALAGEAGAGRGANSGDSVEAAKALAMEFSTVVAITGLVDYLTDGDREAHVWGGSSLMTQVTALGCAQTALMGAYAAIGPAFDTALAALAHFKVAGSAAGKLARGPGSFQMHFLDALAKTQPADLSQVIR